MPHSTTHWVLQIRAGNRDAAQELWERYYRRLVELARKRLSGRTLPLADEDDIAQSAFASFYRAAEQGRFPQLADRNDLWGILIVIAERKILRQRRYQNRQKRRSGSSKNESKFIAIEEIAADEPSPDLCVAAIESFRDLLGQLDNDALRALAMLKLEGYSNEEIAQRLECSVSTIERKLRRIRHEWTVIEETGQERQRE